jgi:hypothetical protein
MTVSIREFLRPDKRKTQPATRPQKPRELIRSNSTIPIMTHLFRRPKGLKSSLCFQRKNSKGIKRIKNLENQTNDKTKK